MKPTRINVPYKDNPKAKGLGAYWDPVKRTMFAPVGADLTLFAQWMPKPPAAPAASSAQAKVPAIANAAHTVKTASPAAPVMVTSSKASHQPLRDDLGVGVLEVADKKTAAAQPKGASKRAPARPQTSNGAAESITGEELQQVAKDASDAVCSESRGVPLSQLLSTVSSSIAGLFDRGVWTAVDVISVHIKNGHYYMEVAERDKDGAVLAKASAMIWAHTAKKIVPSFEKSTGVKLREGIKLLARCRPVLKPQYGFSLEIDALDTSYTVGDLESKKRDIRLRLKREGVFDNQKKLTPPWDYTNILVVASEGAAGLGDFRAESNRLSKLGLCHFEYVYTRFQGEGAGECISADLSKALAKWQTKKVGPPDAIAIIRGGGATNDLAWLNDFELSRTLCLLKIPVLTGIGHEKDVTLIDEVAHQSFDTPSKVILGIEKVISLRAREASENFDYIANAAKLAIERSRSVVDRQGMDIESDARKQVDFARQKVIESFSSVREGSALVVRQAEQCCDNDAAFILERGMSHVLRMRSQVDVALDTVELGAERLIEDARGRVKGLIREILVQGPGPTLGRGYAIVMNEQGRALGRVAEVTPGAVLDVRFSDGSARVLVQASSAAAASANDDSDVCMLSQPDVFLDKTQGQANDN